jgi:hypothetical protein
VPLPKEYSTLSVPALQDTVTSVTLEEPTEPLALLIEQATPGVCDCTVTTYALPAF